MGKINLGVVLLALLNYLLFAMGICLIGFDYEAVLTELMGFVVQEGSGIKSNANLAVYGQGLLQLDGPGDFIIAQRLFVSLFFNVIVSVGFKPALHEIANTLVFISWFFISCYSFLPLMDQGQKIILFHGTFNTN